jgi:hypothetical protein
LFTELPIEIRLIIRRTVLPGPHIVEVRDGNAYFEEEEYTMECRTTSYPPPAILWVCQGSRNEDLTVSQADIDRAEKEFVKHYPHRRLPAIRIMSIGNNPKELGVTKFKKWSWR